MLTQEGSVELNAIKDLNRLKLELNILPPIDVGDYIADLPSDRRAIAFRVLIIRKNQQKRQLSIQLTNVQANYQTN